MGSWFLGDLGTPRLKNEKQDAREILVGVGVSGKTFGKPGVLRLTSAKHRPQ